METEVVNVNVLISWREHLIGVAVIPGKGGLHELEIIPIRQAVSAGHRDMHPVASVRKVCRRNDDAQPVAMPVGIAVSERLKRLPFAGEYTRDMLIQGQMPLQLPS
jgi:hypothetical protein